MHSGVYRTAWLVVPFADDEDRNSDEGNMGDKNDRLKGKRKHDFLLLSLTIGEVIEGILEASGPGQYGM